MNGGKIMRKIRSLTGMPVICHRRRIGRLVQADLSDDLRRLEGIWVDAGLMGTRYISADQLSMIGEKAIIADSRGMRRRCTASPLFRRAVSTGGMRIGAIVGAEMDELSFLVCALELTHGFWDDLTMGRSRIVHFSAQAQEIIIPDSTQENLEEADL